MTGRHWLFSVSDGVATLSLNRPEHGNNINLECLEELRQLSRQIQEDAAIRVVILRSEGRHTSIGMDVSVIGQMAGQQYEPYAERLGAGQRCIDAFEAISRPIIAEIKGFCIGAGIILAACADFRISTDRAVFALPEVKRSIGVIMGLHRVTRIVGVSAVKRMAMLGENFSARQMLEWGFLTEMVPEEKLATASTNLVRKILSLPPLAVTLNKRIADFSYADFLRQSQEFELREQYALNQTADFREAIEAFAEKRTPRYQGK
jgi:enoyl-CoA hydratase/carnithine racemase